MEENNNAWELVTCQCQEKKSEVAEFIDREDGNKTYLTFGCCFPPLLVNLIRTNPLFQPGELPPADEPGDVPQQPCDPALRRDPALHQLGADRLGAQLGHAARAHQGLQGEEEDRAQHRAQVRKHSEGWGSYMLIEARKGNSQKCFLTT